MSLGAEVKHGNPNKHLEQLQSSFLCLTGQSRFSFVPMVDLACPYGGNDLTKCRML